MAKQKTPPAETAQPEAPKPATHVAIPLAAWTHLMGSPFSLVQPIMAEIEKHGGAVPMVVEKKG
jgi:hypothetical protein